MLYDDEHHYGITGGRDHTVKHWKFPPSADFSFSPAISGARENRSVISDAGRFVELLRQAKASMERNDYHAALETLTEAGKQPGFERNPGLLESRRQLYRGLPRKRIVDFFEYKSLVTREYRLAGTGTRCHGRMIAGLDCEGNMVFWDGESQEKVSLPDGFEQKPASMEASSEGRFLLTCGQDKTIKLRDLQNELPTSEIRLEERAVLGVLSPDASRSLVAGASGCLYLLDLAEEKILLKLRGHSGKVRQIRFSDNLPYALSCSGASFWGVADNTIRLWDLQTGQCMNELTGHTGGVNAAVMTADSRWILSAGDDGTVRIWDASSGECTKILKGHDSPVTALDITKDGQYLFTAGTDKTIRLWSLKSFLCEKTISVPDTPLDIQLEKQDSYLLCRDDSPKIQLWFIEWNFEV